MFDFLGQPFAALADDGKARLQPVLRKHPQPLSGYTWATLNAWQEVYHYGWRVDGDTALITCHFGDPDRRHLLMPAGPLTPELARRIVDGARALPYPLKIFGVTEKFIADNPGFVAHFTVEADPASANYVYSAADLATLPGRAYHKKRNLIAGANKEWSSTREPVTAENALECLQMAEEIIVEDKLEVVGTLAHEMSALRHTLRNFGALEQQGLLLRVDGKVAAFGIFEELMPGQAVQHFEKARRSFKGIYQVINKETSQAIAEQGYTLINREEDLGNEGLRQAKLSYYPVEVRPSHVLTFKQP